MAKRFKGNRKCDWCDNASRWRGWGLTGGTACDTHKPNLRTNSDDDYMSEGESQAMRMFGI